MRFLSTLMILLVAQACLAEEAILETPTGPLAGEFLVPDEEGPWPVVLILAGSGPTDRDGNSTMFPGKNNSLKQLAEGLAAGGVASLRVDKRGVGGSKGAAIAEKDLTFDLFIADAAAWTARLQHDERFTSVTVIGHSQGAQVGAAAAWQCDADGFVSIAGASRPVLDLVSEQLKGQLSVRSRVEVAAVIAELEAGRIVEEVPNGLDILFRPSVQPFLISWQRRDPVLDIARLPLPVLVLQGTDDIQITVEDAERLAEARPGARLVLVEGMNHILKEVERENSLGQQMSIVDSTLVVVPEAIGAVLALVREADAGALENHEARKRSTARAAGAERILTQGEEDVLLAGEQDLATAERVGRWARRFAEADDIEYLFGPAEGGYVAEGALVSDRRQDCVSLLYRVNELAHATDHDDALAWALRTRFAGAGPSAVVGPDGRVDYDDPSHLDYSLDMIRTGLWGRDVTPDLTGATLDTVGTSRYAAGSYQFMPKANLTASELTEGDIVWFVLDPSNEGAAKLRDEYGLVIGHIGIVIVEEGVLVLVHAARSGLEGRYEGGTVVTVPLLEYLDRVERFAGVIITRY